MSKVIKKSLIIILSAFLALAILFVGVNGTKTVNASTDPTFTFSGASVRLDTTDGLRFTAKINDALYNQVIDSEGNDIVGKRVGMVIVPETYVNEYKSAESFDGGYHDYFKEEKEGKMLDYVFNANSIQTNNSGEHILNAAIVDMLFDNYNLKFVAIGYLRVDGEYEYLAESEPRSFASVVEAALEDESMTNPDLGADMDDLALLEKYNDSAYYNRKGVTKADDSIDEYAYNGEIYNYEELDSIDYPETYRVEYYYDDGNGNYDLDDREGKILTIDAKLGDTIDAKTAGFVKAKETYIPNYTKSITTGEVARDGEFTIKMYYDNAISVKYNGAQVATLNTMTTSATYHANITIEKADDFGGVQNVYKVAQMQDNKNALLLTGINPTTIAEQGYKYLSFCLYVDFEDNLTFNYKICLTNMSNYGTKDNALRTTDISVYADYITVTDLQGNKVSSVARKTWVNVMIDISKLNGKSSGFNCAFLQMGLQATGGHSYGTYYIGDAKIVDSANYTVESYFNDGTGNYVKDANTEILTAKVGAEVSCNYAYYNGYNPNYTAEGTKLSGVVSADGSLVLKMYYDNAMAIANSDGKAFFNAVTTGYTYTSGVHVERVGTMFEKDDVYKVTEANKRAWIRVCGVQPSDVNTTYKTLKFNMYVEDTSINVVLNTYANNGGSLLGSMHLSGDMAKLTNIKLYNADGQKINNITGKQWVTVVLDLSKAYGKANYIHVELGANAGSVWYMQGATFSTDAF